MVSVLLVDDERIVREGISTLVEWGTIPAHLIGTACNGEEALAVIREQRPEIVITDVKMPGMDGLALIETVRQEKLPVEFIILSGYGEFEYAKKAIRLGVREYILKPCEQQDIVEAVSHIIILRKNRDNAEESELAGAEKTPEHVLVAKIKQCVEENLSKSELSLKYIASNYLHLNPDYMSNQFVRLTGERFTTYLNATRIKKAMELIVTGEEGMVYEVADHIGLGHNPQYFSQVFKKFTGFTPSEYRKLNYGKQRISRADE